MGYQALYFNNGYYNSAYGYKALANNRLGQSNSAVGFQALHNETNGSNNTAVGPYALFINTTGSGKRPSAVMRCTRYNGGGSAESASSGNTAIGQAALFDGAGNYNTAVGYFAGNGAITGSGNVYIGAGVLATMSESNTTRIRNIYSSVASGRAVYVNSDNKIGTLVSSRRFKDEIKPMDKTSETILALKPVTFRYKKEIEPNSAIMFGLIAEEVEKVAPELVTRDDKGEVETVRYEAVNAMLLNEFLKEHRKVEKLEATVAKQQKDFQATTAQQQKQIEALTMGLQKVSAQLEASKPAAQVVNNP